MASIQIIPTFVDVRYPSLIHSGALSIQTGSYPLLSYTVPGAKVLHLSSIHVSGDAEATFTLSINGTSALKIKNSVTERSKEVLFGAGWIKVEALDIVLIEVELDEVTGDFVDVFASIFGFEETL